MHGVDYYRVLGVSPSATDAQIKASYKTLAKKFHPDLNGDAKKMAAVNEAYRVLSDPQSRHRYNQTIDIPRSTARHHYDENHEYVYTPHTRQHTSTASRHRVQPRQSNARSWTPPKRKSSLISKWAWAATFAVLLGCLLGASMQNPIPDGALGAVSGSSNGSSSVVNTPDNTQQMSANPSNTLNDTPPNGNTTYTDPTGQGTNATNEQTNSLQQKCSQYHTFSKHYEKCMSGSTQCTTNSFNSYVSC